MAVIAVMSPKLPLVCRDGFSLNVSDQASYARHWHVHDCPMLLWPRTGIIRSAWTDSAGESEHTLTLAHGTAVLVPANIGHAMRADTRLQQHGEIYFAPELLQDCMVHGAVLLDRASRAMLEALSAPELHPQSASQLIQAFIQQLARSRPLLADQAPTSALEKLIQFFQAALESGDTLPSIDAAALALGMSTRSLQRQCLEQSGVTPVTLRRRMQANAARALLARGTPLSEVSAHLGFANSGHLNRLLNTLNPLAD